MKTMTASRRDVTRRSHLSKSTNRTVQFEVLENRYLLTLVPSFQFVGNGNWSIDAVGSNNTPVGDIMAEVPAGSTVEKAFLYSSTLGSIAAPSVDFDGTIVSGADWTALGPVGSLQAFRADVTTQVDGKIGGGGGPFTFTIESESTNASVDGEVLAIVYSNPAEVIRTIAILDGNSEQGGDQAVFNSAPLPDPSDPSFTALMSLGIGFGFQGDVQFSTVDVNGQRLTSWAGGQDDGDDFNGSLITAGGIGDDPANPVDPFAGPSGDPRIDDELYTLDSFLTEGDTQIVIDTTNPSFDDNIFFSAFNITAVASIQGNIALSPPTDTNPVGTTHTVTAFAEDGDPLVPADGVDVTFEIVAGPNAGDMGVVTTDAGGMASFTYTGDGGPGTDFILASFVDMNGNPQTSNVVEKIWEDTVPPGSSCVDANNDGLCNAADGDVLIGPAELGDGMFDTDIPEGAYTSPIAGAGLVVNDPVDVPGKIRYKSRGDLHVNAPQTSGGKMILNSFGGDVYINDVTLELVTRANITARRGNIFADSVNIQATGPNGWVYMLAKKDIFADDAVIQASREVKLRSTRGNIQAADAVFEALGNPKGTVKVGAYLDVHIEGSVLDADHLVRVWSGTGTVFD